MPIFPMIITFWALFVFTVSALDVLDQPRAILQYQDDRHYPEPSWKMKSVTLPLALSGAVLAAAQYTVSSSATSNDVFDGYMSYSIEFSSFPDFAGNKSQPNTFSDALLKNIGNIIGTKPYIRVGGNTQDYALYNASLPYAINGTFDPKRSADYPTTIFIGPSYFESYSTWKDVKFTHGFNLALGANSSVGWQTLLDTVPLACKALGRGKLNWWEYGNEPDLFSTSAQGSVRPSGWNESIYVAQWLNGTKAIKAQLQTHCPRLVDNDTYGYLAPSFGGVNNRLKEPATWAAGLNVNEDVRLISTHNYISGASSPGVTLQGTLMNHTVTRRSVDAHIANHNKIKAIDPSAPPLIFGEHNSLYNQGKPGLSNTFGAALWGLDFNLYAASVGIKRVHMHMGTNYRYASWQPLTTSLTPIGTRAPYYGNIAVAATLGNLLHRPSTVIEIPLNTTTTAAAYAIYTAQGSTLTRLLVLNMNSYNTTVDGHGLDPLPAADIPVRPVANYTFIIPSEVASAGDLVGVRRLWANGSDAVTGITWDGWSYNYELDKGRPVRLGNVTVGERVVVGDGGVVSVGVPDASAVLLSF